MKDMKSIVRVVAEYSKIPNIYGNKELVTEYKLKPMALSFLQQLFNVDPCDPDPVNRDMIYCYKIDFDRAKALQPYIIDGIIDLDKYDFMLECYEEGT